VRLLRRLASTSPLRERPFLLLFTGRTISMLGSTIAPVALAFAVVDLTGSPSDLGLVLGASFVPQVLFLVVGGVWADRVPRHLLMSPPTSSARPRRRRSRCCC
jgi:MFS family permease